MNVLLVVYAFPPAGGVGVLRAASLARYLPPEGIRLDVLTTKNPSSVGYDPSQLRDISHEVRIHRTLTIDLPFGVKKGLKKFFTHSRPSTIQPAAAAGSEHTHLLKRTFQDLLLPDPQVLWHPVLTRVAPRLIRDRNIDVVLITGAPYSNFLLAKKLRKQFPALKIVLDFRDEWLATSFDAASSFQFGSRSERARDFAIKSEHEAVASATAVVAVTEAALDTMQRRYPQEPATKFHYVPNGFDATRIPVAEDFLEHTPGGKVNVTYVGSVYGSTDPTALVLALKSLPPAVKSRLALKFIGRIEDPKYRNQLLELGNMVELLGYKPQREALEAMNSADYALLITHDPLNVSAKFYDYLGARKPVLACIRPGGDVRRLLDSTRGGWWADSYDVEQMKQMFIDAVARRSLLPRMFHPDSSRIAQFERKVIARKYAELLRGLGRKDSGHYFYDNATAIPERIAR
ncbi:MAG TPA: glycosyltransferase [Terracidiphilus sp.]